MVDGGKGGWWWKSFYSICNWCSLFQLGFFGSDVIVDAVRFNVGCKRDFWTNFEYGKWGSNEWIELC